jgi:hypothetical protein
VKNSELPHELIEQNFDIALNALHFQTKLKFKTIEEKRQVSKTTRKEDPMYPISDKPRPKAYPGIVSKFPTI